MKPIFPTLTLLASSALIAPSSASLAAQPTYVLVHGALFTGQGWKPLSRELEALGYASVTLDLPGRTTGSPTLQDAAKAVCEAVAKIQGPVQLVGHSQGGAVISQALEFCGERVEGLNYLAAVVPKNGEIAFQALKPERDTGFFKVAAEKNGRFELIPGAPVRDVFFQDLNEASAKPIISSMVSEPATIGTTKATYPDALLNSIPKLYIEATADRVISIETQREIHRRIPGMRIAHLQTSHSAFLTQPKKVAQLLVAGIKVEQNFDVRALRLSRQAFNSDFLGNSVVFHARAKASAERVDETGSSVQIDYEDRRWGKPTLIASYRVRASNAPSTPDNPDNRGLSITRIPVDALPAAYTCGTENGWELKVNDPLSAVLSDRASTGVRLISSLNVCDDLSTTAPSSDQVRLVARCHDVNWKEGYDVEIYDTGLAGVKARVYQGPGNRFLLAELNCR